MKLLIQRVKKAKVEVKEEIIGQINYGILVFLGITHEDTQETADFLINKLCHLRIFTDEDEKMNLSIEDVKGELLIISQFTLYADTKNGNRPSFVQAASPKDAELLYEYFIKKCAEKGIKVEHGKFGAHMDVSLINDGPVTILLER